MPYLEATLRNVELNIIKEVLENDAAFHAENGMFLEHLWQNADDPDEAVFLFQIDDLEKTRLLINRLHAEALAADPDVNLPTMKYFR